MCCLSLGMTLSHCVLSLNMTQLITMCYYRVAFVNEREVESSRAVTKHDVVVITMCYYRVAFVTEDDVVSSRASLNMT